MKRPKIKSMHLPLRISPTRIRIGGIHYGVGHEIEDEDGVVWQLLGLMDGSRTVDELVRDFLAERNDLDEGSVREAVATLTASGFVEDAGAPPPPELSEAELERYDRNAHFFGWIDLEPRPSRWEIQRRLKAASVTVLGLGGAGSAAATSLVAAGIGHVECVDFDVIEKSNLNRQVLYTERDIGRPKVESAVARLQELNSDVKVAGRELQVQSSDDVAELMRDADLLLMCADRPTRTIIFWASDAAVATRTPWVANFYNGPMVVVGTFIPFEVPCYRCLRHHAEVTGKDADAGIRLFEVDSNAVIAPTAALTGNFAALEAIYFLGGLSPQTVGGLFHFNLLAYDTHYFFQAPFWDDCPACAGGRAEGPK